MKVLRAVAVVAGIRLSAAAMPVETFAQTVPTLQQLFPTVVASQTISPTAGPTTVTAPGGLSVTIPTGAFGTDPATFQVLEGPSATITPAGTTAIADFAFQVTDSVTGSPVTQFAQPITASITASAIGSQSEYWNVTPTGGLALNPVAPAISGTTLTHKILADAVGWAIVNPAAAPDFTQHGFSTVAATTSFVPGTASILSAGGVNIQIPANAFNIPVTVELLQGSASSFQSSVPSGDAAVTAFALKVADPATNQLVPTFSAPVTARITSSQIGQTSQYLDVAPNGAISANPIPATISGTTLTHPIKAATVGWVVASPVPAPDFTQHGFPTVAASTSFTPGKAAAIAAKGITIDIPGNAFNIPVTVQLLQGPAPTFQHLLPSGDRAVTDFALKVINPATNQLILNFNAPVIAKITSHLIRRTSQYLNVTPSMAVQVNPVPATIRGTVLSHPIAAAAVGWVIDSPIQDPIVRLHGFSKVVATTVFKPGTAAHIRTQGITIDIPARAFTAPVTVQLLQGPIRQFQSAVPSGQSVVTDFALRVVNSATDAPVDTFNAPVLAKISSSQIGPQSEYLNVTPSGAIVANPIAPTISGTTLSHPIAADTVGWVVTSPSVPKATSPVTGLPLGPVMAGGAVLIIGGVGLWRRTVRS